MVIFAVVLFRESDLAKISTSVAGKTMYMYGACLCLDGLCHPGACVKSNLFDYLCEYV